MQSLLCVQAVNEFYKSALKKQEFCVKCDRHSSEIELEMPTDSSWKNTPFTPPAKVCIRESVDSM